MNHALVIRDATEADRDAVVALLEAAHGSQVRSAAAWDWLYGGRLGRYVVADAGNRLVAQYALLPLRVHHRGAVIDASLSLDTATHPDFGGRGLMTQLGELAYNRAGGNLVIGFPNPKSSGVLYHRLGWHELTPFPLLVKPLAGLLRAVTPLPWLTQVERSVPSGVTSFDRFGAWADDIWALNAGMLGTAVVHDSQYLNWRFVDSPYTYELFAADGEDGPAAYSVIRTVPWRRGRLSYLMELAAEPGAKHAAAVALSAAINAARAAGSAGIAAVVTPRNPLRTLLLENGFRTPPARIVSSFSFGARLAGSVAEHDELRSLDAWHVTAADFDHV